MAESSVVQVEIYDLDGEDFFDKFQLEPEEVIDNGMCGEIVLAIPTQRRDLRRVVKKYSLLDQDKKIRNVNMFNNEVAIMKSFSHPFLMKCIIAGRCSDYMAICMYYHRRGTLHDYVGGVDTYITELCIVQVACALRYLHKNHVVHMDVKLDNIFLDDEFNAILGDFGLAVQLSPQKLTLARDQCGGTPRYFSPEMLSSPADKELNPFKVDTYCLGVVLWALALGRDPQDGINYYTETRNNTDQPPQIRNWLLRLLCGDSFIRPTIAEFLILVRRESDFRQTIDNN